MGSTCLSAICLRGVPDSRAASTKASPITWMVAARAIRTKAGIADRDMAIRAVHTDPPSAAAKRMANSRAGKP